MDRLARILVEFDEMEASVMSGSRVQRILETRAAAVAAVPAEVLDPDLLLLPFQIGGQTFGIPLANVDAVVAIRNLTFLPGVEPAFLGVMNVRGKVLTALDLPVFAGRDAVLAAPERRIADATKAIAVSVAGQRSIALVAEEILGVKELFKADMRALDGAPESAFVRSLGPDGMQILDVSALLSDPRLHGSAAGP